METGQKVTWTISNKTMYGLFLEENNGMAEIICYQMGDVNCKLRVFINIDLLKTVE
jgi:hypothetical protein